VSMVCSDMVCLLRSWGRTQRRGRGQRRALVYAEGEDQPRSRARQGCSARPRLPVPGTQPAPGQVCTTGSPSSPVTQSGPYRPVTSGIVRAPTRGGHRGEGSLRSRSRQHGASCGGRVDMHYRLWYMRTSKTRCRGYCHGEQAESHRVQELQGRAVRDEGLREEAPCDDAARVDPEPRKGRYGAQEWGRGQAARVTAVAPMQPRYRPGEGM
jgi:hypothetical protein